MFRIVPVETFIYLQPLGRDKAEVLTRQVLQQLSRDLTGRFGLDCKVAPTIDLTEDAYDPMRDQYLAAIILSNLKRMGFPEAKKVLGIVGEDLYADELNYVFGQAELGGKYGVISTKRLLPPGSDESLLYERTFKEAVHELGHTFGVGHCPSVQCVMHFSNTIHDTDVKAARFCNLCESWLSTRMKRAAN
ncbi:MAG: archaemetzincin family Zn-dependent metalloprotease [Chloroflexi bacterium]|nr:archaemetzincin family Zn-dependent metalloprotease [Chloroflexota bacterium]